MSDSYQVVGITFYKDGSGGAIELDKEKKVKNRFSWNWMQERLDRVGANLGKNNLFSQTIGESYQKPVLEGVVYCAWCKEKKSYASSGKKALVSHIMTERHYEQLLLRRTNQNLPGTSDARNTSTEPVKVPMLDRIANTEAMALAFMAENSLPFALAPKLLEFTKAMSKDQKALSGACLEEDAARYKMVYGLGEYVKDDIRKRIGDSYFSLNVDEATAKNTCRVLDVMIAFFDNAVQKVAVFHLKSIELVKVNAETVTNAILNMLDEFCLHRSKLLAVLMDSCAVMRGSKSGVERRLRDSCQNMLDVDGDTCHHSHNAAKKFTQTLSGNVEGLFYDLNTHFKYSADQKESYINICQVLQLSSTTPQAHCSTRWLSVYDCACHTSEQLDAYTLLFYCYLKEEEKSEYYHLVVDIYRRRHVQAEGRDYIRHLRKEIQAKKFTTAGAERVARIQQYLFQNRRRYLAALKIYKSVLPLLCRYTLLFQKQEPMIHLLYEEMEELLREFLGFVVEPDCLINKSGFALSKIDIDRFLLPSNRIFFGEAKDQIQEFPELKEKLKLAYITTAKYLQQKMPYNITLLRQLSSLSPEMRGKSECQQFLMSLACEKTNVLDANEKIGVDLEIRRYCTDPTFYSEFTRIDTYWYLQGKKYPILSKLALSLLSIISAPEVERSFSRMAQSLNEKTARLKVDSVDAIQSIKQYLLTQKETAVSLFSKKDVIYDHVPKELVQKIRCAYKKRQEVLQSQREKKENVLKNLSIKSQQHLSRKGMRQVFMEAAEKARKKHRQDGLKRLVARYRIPKKTGTLDSSVPSSSHHQSSTVGSSVPSSSHHQSSVPSSSHHQSSTVGSSVPSSSHHQSSVPSSSHHQSLTVGSSCRLDPLMEENEVCHEPAEHAASEPSRPAKRPRSSDEVEVDSNQKRSRQSSIVNFFSKSN